MPSSHWTRRSSFVSVRLSLALLLAPSLALPTAARAQAASAIRPGDELLTGAFAVTLDSATIAASPARTLADLLAGRVAGLNVTYVSGAAGFAPEITARGSATVYGPGRPLLYIDGTLIREDRHLLGPDLDRNRPSHAWGLPTEEIAEVQVALGPAAGTLLAFGAPRGAIFVRTKRGGSGAWRMRSALEWIAQATPDALPTRTLTTGDLSSGGTTDFCPLTDQATGFCTATGTTLRRAFGGRSPWVSEIGARAALSASGEARVGNVSVATVRVGTNLERSPSLTAAGPMDRLDLGLTADSRPWRGLSVATRFRADVTRGAYTKFGDDGLLQLGVAAVQPEDPTFAAAFRSADSVIARSRPYSTDRVQAGVDLRWAARPWLSLYALGATERSARGTDRTVNDYNAFSPYELLSRTRELWSYREGMGSATVGARATRALPRGITLSAEVGGHLSNTDFGDHRVDETTGVGGGGSGGSETILHVDVRNRAVFTAVRLQLGPDRAIGGGFRKETSEIFDAAFGDDPFNTIHAEWTLSREAWFPRIPGVDRLHLRGAYGESGDHEATISAFQFAGLVRGHPLFPRRLQRTLEREAGADVDLLGGRARLSATAYTRSLRDGLLNAGGGPVPLMHGSWTTKGHEYLLTLPSREGRAVRLDATLSWSSARTGVTSTPGLSSTANLLGGARVHFTEGRPFGELLVTPYDWVDGNSDGIIDATEITLGTPAGAGVTQPTDLVGFSLRAGWRDRLTAGFTLDGKSGHVKADATQRFACQVLVCANLYAGSPAEQARAVALGYTGSFTGPVEPADFVRLREVWLRATLPSRIGPVQLGAASVMLSLRNAGIWSRYPSGDPETGSFAFATVARGDYFTPGLLRQLTLRLDLTP